MPLTVVEAYGEAQAKLAGIDMAAAGRRLDLPVSEGRLGIPFFGESHEVGQRGCMDPAGEEASPAVGLVLCQYVLRFPRQIPLPGRRVSFREFEGAGPLMVSFANNTHKTICSTYGRNLSALQSAARRLGGVEAEEKHNFDLFLRFPALPHLPVFLQFNASDENFPSTASLRFQQSAQTYLNLQALFILGTYFTGRLIGSAR